MRACGPVAGKKCYGRPCSLRIIDQAGRESGAKNFEGWKESKITNIEQEWRSAGVDVISGNALIAVTATWSPCLLASCLITAFLHLFLLQSQ